MLETSGVVFWLRLYIAALSFMRIYKGSIFFCHCNNENTQDMRIAIEARNKRATKAPANEIRTAQHAMKAPASEIRTAQHGKLP